MPAPRHKHDARRTLTLTSVDLRSLAIESLIPHVYADLQRVNPGGRTPSYFGHVYHRGGQMHSCNFIRTICASAPGELRIPRSPRGHAYGTHVDDCHRKHGRKNSPGTTSVKKSLHLSQQRTHNSTYLLCIADVFYQSGDIIHKVTWRRQGIGHGFEWKPIHIGKMFASGDFSQSFDN